MATTPSKNFHPSDCKRSRGEPIMRLRHLASAVRTAITGAMLALMVCRPAWASGTNMPWEQPLQQVLDSVQGPVAKIIAVLIIIVTGLTLAFGETSGGFRRLIQIVFGI